MFIIFIALLALALIVFISDNKSEPNRYISFIILTLSMRPAAVSLKTYIIPMIEGYQISLLNPSLFFVGFLYTISICFPMYFILLYSLAYSELFRFKRTISKIIFKVLLLIPSLWMCLFSPISSPGPQLSTDYIVLLVWTIPYAICSIVFLLVAYFKEKHRFLKNERLINLFFIIPIQAIFILSEVIIPIFMPEHLNYLHITPFFYLVVYLLFFILKFIILGVRYLLQKKRHHYEKMILDSSMSIFNHSIKKEISKISLYTTLLKNYSSFYDNEEEETIDAILDSSYSLLDVINKMNFHTQEISLHNDCVELKEIIYRVLAFNKKLLTDKEVELFLSIHEDLNVYCDRVHFTELLNNIIKNAVEAVKSNGVIEIKTELFNKYLSISVKDNGYGIKENNIRKVTNPFFSTKKSNHNYGLGLYYCKNVIESHGGFLEINAVEKAGTEIIIFLPSNRVHLSYSNRIGSVKNGLNRNRYCRR